MPEHTSLLDADGWMGVCAYVAPLPVVQALVRISSCFPAAPLHLQRMSFSTPERCICEVEAAPDRSRHCAQTLRASDVYSSVWLPCQV